MKSLAILCLLIFKINVAFADPDYEYLSKYYSPVVIGDTLYIKGRIDSHIYDFLTMDAKKVENVKYVSLNSYGGNHNWALQVGEKLQSLKKITVLEAGNVCASACVYLFSTGIERVMHQNTWLGVHGARLTGSYATSFAGYCFVELEDSSIFVENKKGCADFLKTWYDVSFKATAAAFDLMEKAGVSAAAREYYFSLEDDALWYEQLNVLRKPDWVVTTDIALEYGFATQIK